MSNVGKPISHDIPQAPGQIRSHSAEKPRLAKVEMPDTMHDMSSERTSGNATAWKDAGSLRSFDA